MFVYIKTNNTPEAQVFPVNTHAAYAKVTDTSSLDTKVSILGPLRSTSVGPLKVCA